MSLTCIKLLAVWKLLGSCSSLCRYKNIGRYERGCQALLKPAEKFDLTNKYTELRRCEACHLIRTNFRMSVNLKVGLLQD